MIQRGIYYDLETTGTRPGLDRIVEIAAYDPQSGEEFSSLVNPGSSIPEESTAINGISNEMVAKAPPFSEVGPAFFRFCGENAVLIAHNNDQFDALFLAQECKRLGVSFPSLPMIDSLKWARKYRPDLPRHNLQFLREIYGIPANTAHRARDDVMTLYQVFSQMIDDLSWERVLSLL